MSAQQVMSEEDLWVVEEHEEDGIPQPEAVKNQDFCYQCNKPGELVCCDYCPHSCHLECAGLKVNRDLVAVGSVLCC